jgi:hypothetical protein
LDISRLSHHSLYILKGLLQNSDIAAAKAHLSCSVCMKMRQKGRDFVIKNNFSAGASTLYSKQQDKKMNNNAKKR